MSRHSQAIRIGTAMAVALAAAVFGSITGAREAGVRPSESGPHPVASPLEVVIVTTLRSRPTNAGIVGPVQHISMSASVRTDDLDPQSPAYRTEIHDRIGQAARGLCDRMEFQYPVRIPDRIHCRQAVEQSVDQIDTAVQNGGSTLRIETP